MRPLSFFVRDHSQYDIQLRDRARKILLKNFRQEVFEKTKKKDAKASFFSYCVQDSTATVL